MLGTLGFTRAVLLGSLVAASALGHSTWRARASLALAEREVERDAPLVVNAIQRKALELNDLQQQRARDGFGPLSDPDLYIRRVASQSGVGQVTVAPADRRLAAGLVDRSFRITPQDRRRPFPLSRVSDFIYRLEASSERAKVTRVELEPLGGRRSGDHGTGAWTFDVVVTSRQATSP